MPYGSSRNCSIMGSVPNFPILPSDPLCEAVLASGFSTFGQFAAHVKLLTYGRPTNTDDPLAVLHEKRGTCSSKHQLLAAVAHQCGHTEVLLTVGIYEMSEENTPGVGAALGAASQVSIPEAHCYLAIGGERFDFTGLPSGQTSPFDALIAEHVVLPGDLPTTKARLHQQALARWAAEVGVSPRDAWAIRETCILALTATRSRSDDRPHEA